MPKYLVMQIKRGAFTYQQCIEIRPQYKEQIENEMVKEGLESLIIK